MFKYYLGPKFIFMINQSNLPVEALVRKELLANLGVVGVVHHSGMDIQLVARLGLQDAVETLVDTVQVQGLPAFRWEPLGVLLLLAVH